MFYLYVIYILHTNHVQAKFGISPDSLVHVAPSLDRVWTTNDGTVRTVLPVGMLFHMGRARFLVGQELLGLQGFPYPRMPCLTSFTSSQLSDIAGNAFSGTVVQAFGAAITACFHWTTDSEEEEEMAFKQFTRRSGKNP